ncbi:hypothetical protein H0E87_000190 [Populus deltoides]|uniref:PPM-type phosphatase domain-containing protein n=1 Tax=Populus deltoides TaxID=3696 RepID=A0A8T2ZLK6_POPDE|nr:hypothetical protein H0E87_000190 [Populus deltoides]
MTEHSDEDTEFITLRSDGLWKLMSNQEAYDCYADLEDAEEAAKKLIEEALNRGSMDDISCMVVAFL